MQQQQGNEASFDKIQAGANAGEGFAWGDHMAVTPQSAVAVYLTSGGAVAIRQPGKNGVDAIVTLSSREACAAVVDAIQRHGARLR